MNQDMKTTTVEYVNIIQTAAQKTVYIGNVMLETNVFLSMNNKVT